MSQYGVRYIVQSKEKMARVVREDVVYKRSLGKWVK